MSLISVIMPVYNVEEFLRQSIDSVLEQTYKNFELYLVDDGSKDSSGKICDEYALKDDRIIVIHKKNGGLSSARNAALEKFSGEYVCFIDSDDYFEPTFLEKMLDAVKDGDHDFSCCCYDEVNEKCEFLRECGETITEPIVYSGNVVDGYLSADYYFPYAWGKLYKRELFSDVRYVEGMNFEDNDALVRLLKRSKGVKVIPDILIHYRKREKSITSERKCKLDIKSFDVFRSYRICATELQGTRWEKEYYMKSCGAWLQYWKYSNRYEKADKKTARKMLVDVLKKKSGYIDFSVFGIKDRLIYFAKFLCYFIIK